MVAPKNWHAILVLSAGLTLCLPWGSAAQISPGELSRPHAMLEGISNCTACHALGEAVKNDKCLDCHTELGTRITARRGFHGKLGSSPCVECHKEHHGRGFALVRFNTEEFDHASVGFSLEGKHRRLECARCHTAEHIKASDVRANAKLLESRTYLGLERECIACHTDIHRGQLSPDCQQCHGSNQWRPASGFVHDRARFRLTGRHAEVSCEGCHPRSGGESTPVKFAGLQFSSCSSCHGDPHRGRFRQPCEGCHTTGGWKSRAGSRFNHAATRFELRGRHATVPCDGCHVPSRERSSGKLTQSFAVGRFKRCADCHKDPHRGEFAGRPDGGACESCHTEDGFAPTRFSHDSARFALQGRHRSVACARCHTPDSGERRAGTSLSFSIRKYQQCADCHADAHGGQFAFRADKGACESCHSVEGYLPPTYTVREHNLSRFALTGSHDAVPCAACHPAWSVQGKSTRRFVWKENVRCTTCHRDVHLQQFNTGKYGGCESCHSTASWPVVAFNHAKTGFPLSGKHAGIACERCHTVARVQGDRSVRQFAGTPTRCSDCHGRSASSTHRATMIN